MIHTTAIVSTKAKIGSNVKIGPFSIIHDNVIIEDNTIIDSYCEIGYPTPLSNNSPLRIGYSSIIRSHSTLYEGSEFGPNLVTGHRVTVREGTLAGRNFQIGTLGDIQGACKIGDYVKLHSNVHIGRMTNIGNFVWIFPYVVFTNDPHPPSEVLMGASVNDYAVIATMSVVLPGVNIGEGALVAAHSTVKLDVQSNTVVAGSPAKFICQTNKIHLKDGTNRMAYPWRRHFHRGYPEEILSKWIQEFDDTNNSCF